jgi:hypothetical protein
MRLMVCCRMSSALRDFEMSIPSFAKRSAVSPPALLRASCTDFANLVMEPATSSTDLPAISATGLMLERNSTV